MNTRRRSIVLLSAAVNSTLLTACALNVDSHPAAASALPIVIDNYYTPTLAELYAQRYPTVVTQVTAGDRRRFIHCQDACSGATPKTPVANLATAVVRQAQDKIGVGRSRATVLSQRLTVPANTAKAALTASITKAVSASPAFVAALPSLMQRVNDGENANNEPADVIPKVEQAVPEMIPEHTVSALEEYTHTDDGNEDQ